MASRPLSPHVFIYRFGYTMALSIVHRGTGLLLSFGLLLLTGWLVALGAGSDTYASFVNVVTSWPVKLLLAALLVSFCYHFANGIRHLCWDMGRGLERHQARASARVVVIFTVLAAAPLLYLLFAGRGGTP